MGRNVTGIQRRQLPGVLLAGAARARGEQIAHPPVGVKIPDSRFAALAIEAARDIANACLFNHSARTYYLGALLGNAKSLRFDSEILFIACMLHDLGLAPRYMGELPFEIQGAQAARQLLSKAGYPSTKTEIVWDGIAMHTQAIADFKRPEILLVSAGAAADVTGAELGSVNPRDVQAVVAAFPRLAFKTNFVETCATAIRRYPSTAGRSFMRDIGQRTVPAYVPSNICDRIAAAPFAE